MVRARYELSIQIPDTKMSGLQMCPDFVGPVFLSSFNVGTCAHLDSHQKWSKGQLVPFY